MKQWRHADIAHAQLGNIIPNLHSRTQRYSAGRVPLNKRKQSTSISCAIMAGVPSFQRNSYGPVKFYN